MTEPSAGIPTLYLLLFSNLNLQIKTIIFQLCKRHFTYTRWFKNGRFDVQFKDHQVAQMVARGLTLDRKDDKVLQAFLDEIIPKEQEVV